MILYGQKSTCVLLSRDMPGGTGNPKVIIPWKTLASFVYNLQMYYSITLYLTPQIVLELVSTVYWFLH